MTEKKKNTSKIGELGAEDSEVDLQLNPDSLLGTTVAGRYEIMRCIGVGGMGVVFLAHQVGLGREVVVKVMKASQSGDQEARARFEREAQGLSKLDHQNIVHVYDFGRDRDMYYIAMEFVDGETLSRFMRRSDSMDFATFGPIAIQIVGALAEAHRNGIIHRDIKPGNIMLCNRQGFPSFVKVLDFGLSKLINNRNDVTKKNDLIGSASFMAPEQILGNAPVDERVDVYALGVLFFFMLSGKRPFEGDDDISILYHQVHTPAPQLNELLPARHDVPHEVSLLIARCLRKSPEDRPRDAGELILLLRNGVENSSLLRTPWGSPGEFTPFPRPKADAIYMNQPHAPPEKSDKKGMILGLALLAILALSGAIYFGLSARDPEPAIPVDVSKVDEVADDKAVAKEGDKSGIARGLRVAGLSALESGDYEDAVKNFARALQMGGAGDDVPELLEIARSLMDKSGEKSPPTVATTQEVKAVAPTTAPSRAPAPARSRTRTRSAPSSKPTAEEKEEAPMGMMLIASSPNGIVFKLDDSDGGVTPAKLSASVGTHKITYFKDGEVVTTRTLEVREGSLAIADVDIAALMAPKVVEAVDEAPTKPADTVVERSATVEPPRAVVATPTPTLIIPKNTPKASEIGELLVQSPNVYGEIYVNGKSVGFPPMVVKGVLIGPAKIEIKVDGNVRRTKVVRVSANKRTTIRL